MNRWCVVFEEYDCYGNQGIGTDVISADDITQAVGIMNDYLADTMEKNKDVITSARVIGANIVPDLQKEV